MKRLVVTLLLVMLIGSATPVMGKHRRAPEELLVFDYTPPAWQEAIRLTVDRFNAVMPEEGPLLVYVSRAPLTCPPEPEAADGIAVCWENSTEFGGLSSGERQGAQIVLMEKYTGEGDYERMACHEFMHVLTGIPDNYGAAPDQSCVWGYLREPGPYDLQILTEEFPMQTRRTDSVNADTDVDSIAAGADVAPGTDTLVADAAAKRIEVCWGEPEEATWTAYAL